MFLFIPYSVFIHEILHGFIALPFAILLYQKTRSLKLVAILYGATYFIDLDHLFDYFTLKGFVFNVYEFVSGEYFYFTDKMYEPFHAWEWIIVISLISYKKGWNSIVTAICLGILPHLILDSISVGSFLFYSVLYRVSQGFI